MAATATPNPMTVEVGDSSPNTGWKPELHEIPIDSIAVSGNVRANVGDIVSLIESVKTHGVISPIRVADIGAGQYELVYGQRRLAAAKAAGLATIPAIVDAEQPERADRAVDQLIENLQRADLNALDTATAYRWLLDSGMTQRQLAEELGISQPTIANTLALLKAPDEIQAKVASGELTRSHVEAIAKLPKGEQAEVARRIVEHGLSVDQVQEEIELAKRRQAEEDRQRAERDRQAKAIPETVAKVPDVLAKAKLDKASVTLIVEPGPFREALLAEGYTLAEQPKTVVNIYGAGTKVDPCYTAGIRLLRWYPSWGANYPPQVETVCIDGGHKKARDEAATKVQAAENARWKREQEKRAKAERDERRKGRGELAGTAAVIAADPSRMAKTSLFLALAGQSYGPVVDWIAEEVFKTEDPSVVEDAQLWAAIRDMGDQQVATWRARLLAQVLLSWPADDPLRKELTNHAVEPKAKPVKASKVAKVAAAKAEAKG